MLNNFFFCFIYFYGVNYCGEFLIERDCSGLFNTHRMLPNLKAEFWLLTGLNESVNLPDALILSVSAGHSQVGWRATMDPETNLPGYVVINAGVHYKYKHFMLAVNALNITNQTYWMGAYNNGNKWPGAPRNFMANLGYSF
jgi:outer membrane receptor protein involved in Fe transport